MKRAAMVIGAALVGLLVACGSSRQALSIGADCETGFCAPNDTSTPASFGDASAPDADTDSSAGLCPSTACPVPFATCSSSRFACDVDTRNDPANCGACGAACPAPLGSIRGVNRCKDGTCVFECEPGFGDCNGIVDDGCETSLTSVEHCGACGVACKAGEACSFGKCVPSCAPPLVSCNGECVDLTQNDGNCGACGVACDPYPPEWTPLPNTYNGCAALVCQMKCLGSFRNCNNDETDGCETDIASPNDQHCGGCGIACPAGTKCRSDFRLEGLRCACPSPTVDCSPDPRFTLCVDLSSDPTNCGACGRVCPGGPSSSICRNGVCELACAPNTADCNGVAADGCEKNLRSDPENCGACGHVCDAVPGQPCVDGSCAVDTCGGIR